MRVYGGPPLVPQPHGEGESLLQHMREGLRLLRPGAQGAVHVLGVPQHQFLHPVFPDQLPQTAEDLRLLPGVDHFRIPGQQAGEIGDRRSCVGVSVVNGQYAHSLPPFSVLRPGPHTVLIIQYFPGKKK